MRRAGESTVFRTRGLTSATVQSTMVQSAYSSLDRALRDIVECPPRELLPQHADQYGLNSEPLGAGTYGSVTSGIVVFDNEASADGNEPEGTECAVKSMLITPGESPTLSPAFHELMLSLLACSLREYSPHWTTIRRYNKVLLPSPRVWGIEAQPPREALLMLFPMYSGSLTDHHFGSALAARAFFMQFCMAIYCAQRALRFEHRDLKLDNMLMPRHRSGTLIEYRLPDSGTPLWLDLAITDNHYLKIIDCSISACALAPTDYSTWLFGRYGAEFHPSVFGNDYVYAATARHVAGRRMTFAPHIDLMWLATLLSSLLHTGIGVPPNHVCIDSLIELLAGDALFREELAALLDAANGAIAAWMRAPPALPDVWGFWERVLRLPLFAPFHRPPTRPPTHVYSIPAAA